MKKIGLFFLKTLLFIWQLPQNLVALVMIPFLGKLKVVDKTNWCTCYEGENMQGGISLGSFAFVSPYSAKKPEVVAHELKGHTVDSRILGPLYLLAIGLPSILNAWFDFTDCYYSFYTEQLANKHAKLGVDEYCSLYFKEPLTQ